MEISKKALLLSTIAFSIICGKYVGSASDLGSSADISGELAETRHKERSSRRIIAGRHKRQALRKNETNIWTSKIIYYYFDSLVEKRKKTMEGFLRAAKAWEKDTCVKFEELKNRRGDTSAEKDVLIVTIDEEDVRVCELHVGKLGGEQPLFLGEGCESFGHAAHEIGHVLGLYHTQNSGSPTKNPKMTPKEENYEQTIGSPMISFIDLRMVNKLYDCDGNCKGIATICEYGGFPHPQNCSKCISPRGYGGDLCDKMPLIVTGAFGLACGGELNATNTWKEQDLAFASANNDGEYSICTYWIRVWAAPAGNRIEMKIDAINGVSALRGCVEGGIEIKTNEDQRVTGHKFCLLDEEEEIILKSTRTLIPVILYSSVMFPVIFVKIEYRYEVDEKLAADQKS